MKKFFALLMSLAMVLSLAACGGGEATEEGGSGGKAAAPIARQLFDIYMAR